MSFRLSVIRAVSAVALLAGTSFGTSEALADGKTAESSPNADYKKTCDLGNVKVLARDFPGAIEQYRKAIEMNPKQALGYYLLGEAELGAANLTEADAAWNRASLTSGEQDDALRAKILFVIADLRERQLKWDDARAAWQVYIDWATAHPQAHAFPATGQSRLQVIDSMTKQDKAYEIVRQRIQETKAGTTFTDMSKPSPALAP